MDDKQNEYLKHRAKSDVSLPASKQLIANILGIDISVNDWVIEETNFYEDTRKCADLKVFNDNECHLFGHRMRLKEKYVQRYPADMTLRDAKLINCKSEFIKVMEGAGEYNLYGFYLNGIIFRWILASLINFRKAHYFNTQTDLYEPKGCIRYKKEANKESWDTEFRAYCMVSIKEYDDCVSDDDKIIMASSDGYFNDLIIKKGMSFNGTKKTIIKIKDKEDRIDGN